MTQQTNALAAITLEQYLEDAASVILQRDLSLTAAPLTEVPQGKLRVGVDLGTAYLVIVVLDAFNKPLVGEWQFAQVVRDGLIVDYIGATDLLKDMKRNVERRLGRALNYAVSGYPPGVASVEVRATANVVQAAGLDCPSLIDEPSAANQVLHVQNGAIVDVGGGTTGIAIIKDGKVVYTADEPTGGTHFSLVIAGSLGITFEEAEALKIRPEEQSRLYPLVMAVMEKVGSIVLRHVEGFSVEQLTLVGGASAFQGMAEVIQNYTGIPTSVPIYPAFVTPLGLAMFDTYEN